MKVAKSKVAVIRVTPDTILQDIDRLIGLAGVSDALAAGQDDDPEGQHLLALSVSRGEHHAVAARRNDPGAREARLPRSGLRPEQDGRHQRVQGRRPQPLRPDLQALRDPRPLQLQGRGHDVGALRAEGADARAQSHLPRGHPDPRLLLRQEHRPLADDQVPHLHDDDRRDEERVRRAAEHAAALHALVDPRDAGRSPRDPEGDPLRAVRDHGRHDRRQRTRARARCIRSSRT